MSQFLPRDGDAISYIGEGELFGAQGQLLLTAGRGGHVKWATGPRVGQVDLVDRDDLVSSGRARTAVVRDELDDSLEVGSITTTGIRHVQDEEGTVGVLNFMASSGHLSGFAGIAEEALGVVAHLVRQDPGMREVVAQLDDDEGEALVQLAATALLRDAFGQIDE